MQRRTSYFALLLIVLAAIGIVLLLVPLGMRTLVTKYTYDSAASAPEAEVALILGASVYRGKPSPILASRADAAIELYRSGKVKKILMTGDNGELLHDEVTPVRKYLIEAGIPAEDIFLDHAGFDTYSSMYRSRAVYGASSIIVVTQDFHLPRALWIARHLGIEAYGVPADGLGSPYNYLREIPASIKALVDVYGRREPKYLGEMIPLNESGEATWY